MVMMLVIVICDPSCYHVVNVDVTVGSDSGFDCNHIDSNRNDNDDGSDTGFDMLVI